jgi:xylulokinase
VVFAIGAAFRLLDVPDGDEPVVLTGGGARPPVVRQLLADVLRRPVRHLPLRSASAIGAALLAGRGVGLDVVPAGPSGEVVDPQGDAGLRGAADRWART